MGELISGSVSNLPAGTVTFLFTDIEGSTRLWERYPELARAALSSQDALIEDIVGRCDGQAKGRRGQPLERYESGLEAARSALQPEGFEKAWQNGLAMSMDQAIEFALDDQ